MPQSPWWSSIRLGRAGSAEGRSLVTSPTPVRTRWALAALAAMLSLPVFVLCVVFVFQFLPGDGAPVWLVVLVELALMPVAAVLALGIVGAIVGGARRLIDRRP
jgi:hypothetical protein